jgi:hypothetical protein
LIISASYKTDIPTFYAKWFRARLKAGFCRMMNPYNRRQHYTVPLRGDSVDGFVFWTKNATPFTAALADVAELGTPFLVQYTINRYPRFLENRVVDADRAIENAREIAELFGPKVVVWRYDTIILTDATNLQFHRNNFQDLAGRLQGVTDEVVVSFLQEYKKTKRNMDLACKTAGQHWYDPPLAEKQNLLADLARCAFAHGMKLTICAQPVLMVEGTAKARCVDAERMASIGGEKIEADKHGSRKHCGCFRSRDIGDYDTCPHGCVYCYAVRNRQIALDRYRNHDPTSEYLLDPKPNEMPRSEQLKFDV